LTHPLDIILIFDIKTQISKSFIYTNIRVYNINIYKSKGNIFRNHYTSAQNTDFNIFDLYKYIYKSKGNIFRNHYTSAQHTVFKIF